MANCIDKSVSTILMGLSKAFDCLHVDLIITKLHVNCFDYDSLRLMTFQIETEE